MKAFGVDLYESVKKNAERIYEQVAIGRMPLDETRWSDEKVATFKAWVDAGCPWIC